MYTYIQHISIIQYLNIKNLWTTIDSIESGYILDTLHVGCICSLVLLHMSTFSWHTCSKQKAPTFPVVHWAQLNSKTKSVGENEVSLGWSVCCWTFYLFLLTTHYSLRRDFEAVNHDFGSSELPVIMLQQCIPSGNDYITVCELEKSKLSGFSHQKWWSFHQVRKHLG